MVDSRLAHEGSQVRRRRECAVCGARFTTFETVEMVLPRVVKGSGEREPYSEEKLRNGMLRALEKRPVATEAIDAAVQRIRQHLLALGEREVASRLLGEWVMVELRELDQVGYVRFASVYRSFQDVSDFREELERLEGQPSPELRRQQIPLPLSEDKS